MRQLKAQADASIQIDTSTQDLARPLDSSEVWSPLSGKSSQSLPGTAEEADNPNPNSSDHESDSQSKDAHDVTHCAITDDDSEAWVPLSGQQSLSGAEASRTFDNLSESWTPLRGQQCLSGEEVSNVMGRDDSDHDFENFSEDTLDAQPTTSLQADRGEVTPRYSTSPLLFEDECSTEFDLHSSDPQHLSPTSQSSNNLIPDDLDESVDSSVFETRQSFADSESVFVHGEQFSSVYEDSTDESINEETHLPEFNNEEFPQCDESAPISSATEILEG
ncbi:clumping factor B-like [Cheilinus undulatus]|uniref:clumping factor B-like n=1 Tax=Cheilinus undulatus TaxID=241271 RepID=UPI001BD6BD1F|nr:clumping factor B-like [Cheilinus undulatus]